MEKMKFSNEWLIKRGFSIDLGDDGDFIHEGYALIDEDGDVTIPGTYKFRGWEFSDCELWVSVPLFVIENAEFVEELLVGEEGQDWTWGVRPTDDTKVLKKGEDGALRRTVFEGFEKQGEESSPRKEEKEKMVLCNVWEASEYLRSRGLDVDIEIHDEWDDVYYYVDVTSEGKIVAHLAPYGQAERNIVPQLLDAVGIQYTEQWERTCWSDTCAHNTHDAYTLVGVVVEE